jgi:hypothetical protein
VHDGGKPVALLAWHGFRENLVEDVDRLLDYAQKNGLLDHALIWDGTLLSRVAVAGAAAFGVGMKIFIFLLTNSRKNCSFPLLE